MVSPRLSAAAATKGGRGEGRERLPPRARARAAMRPSYPLHPDFWGRGPLPLRLRARKWRRCTFAGAKFTTKGVPLMRERHGGPSEFSEGRVNHRRRRSSHNDALGRFPRTDRRCNPSPPSRGARNRPMAPLAGHKLIKPARRCADGCQCGVLHLPSVSREPPRSSGLNSSYGSFHNSRGFSRSSGSSAWCDAFCRFATRRWRTCVHLTTRNTRKFLRRTVYARVNYTSSEC